MIAQLLSIVLLTIALGSDIEDVVFDFHQLKTERAEVNFINAHKATVDPSVKAYVVSISMKQAEYLFNPNAKLQVFNFNKKLLNQLVNENQSNVHLRYVRLVAQENTPKILGYNDHIEEDKLFLKKKLETNDESDFLDTYIKKNTSL